MVAVTFMAQMRSDVRDTRRIVQQAQARLMLHAAVMYLQECSRIGWGDATGETFGWTDVRDGSLGPRGARPANGSGAATAVPAPEWWTQHSDWPSYKPFPSDDDLPAPGQRRGGWPCPGTAVRCPMAMPVVPPYATQLRFNYNTVPYPVATTDPSWSAPWGGETTMPAPYNAAPYDSSWQGVSSQSVSWRKSWIGSIFDAGAGAKGMLDPQPVKDSWTEFRRGELDPNASGGDWTNEAFTDAGEPIPGARATLKVTPGSENLSWFRIYRETSRDHDDVDNVGTPGTEWWDKVGLVDAANPPPGKQKLLNWNTFIIACGAGSTRGYRFWDDAEIGDWEHRHGLPAGTGRCLEPVTAEESGLFPDAQTFHDLLAETQILWFRGEWSALQSGARNAGVYDKGIWRNAIDYLGQDGMTYNQRLAFSPNATGSLDVSSLGWQVHPDPFLNIQYATTWAEDYAAPTVDYESDTRSSSPKVYGGNIKWLQRLDRDPVLW